MSELKSSEENSAAPKGFWRRQFQKESTAPQRRFDWLFGVILPVICFTFDPAVFKNGFAGEAYLGSIKSLAYVLSFTLVLATMARLIWGEKLKWLNAPLAGLFAVGGAVALGIAVVLTPLSLLGLIIIIGVLGFTPFLTSLVYFRHAVRAFRAAKPLFERKVLIYAVVLSALFGASAPYALNASINRLLDEMRRGDAATIRANAKILKYFAPLVDSGALVREYHWTDRRINPEEKNALAESYFELTGERIESDNPMD